MVPRTISILHLSLVFYFIFLVLFIQKKRNKEKIRNRTAFSEARLRRREVLLLRVRSIETENRAESFMSSLAALFARAVASGLARKTTLMQDAAHELELSRRRTRCAVASRHGTTGLEILTRDSTSRSLRQAVCSREVQTLRVRAL